MSDITPAVVGGVIGFAGAGVTFALTQMSNRAQEHRAERNRRVNRSLDTAEVLQEELLDVMSLAAAAGYPAAFIEQRKRWSRAVRRHLPNLESDREHSELRGLFNHTHEALLAVENAWRNQEGPVVVDAALDEALATCAYLLKALVDYRRWQIEPRPYDTAQAKMEGQQSQDYWRLP